MNNHYFSNVLTRVSLGCLLLALCTSASAMKSSYDAARQGDLNTLRQYRFEGKDLFIPDERGFTPYELAALHADPETKAGLRKQVEVMLWLKEYKPENHYYGKATIKLIQSGLNALGYDVGQPDGMLGKRTSTAIKAFQKANKLAETGRPGPQWLGIFYKDILKDTQFKLSRLGFDTKGTDGLMGKNTRAAIDSFRTQKSLSDPTYEHLDSLLISKLNAIYKKENDKREAQIALSARQEQSREIQYIQAGLRTLGYRVGRIDGVAGSKTTGGIKQFQKKYRLKVTGDVNDSTMEKMRSIFLKETQRKLNKLGFSVGKADGKMGKKTQRAVERYKKSVRLKSSQGVDATLIAAVDDSYDKRKISVVKKAPRKKSSSSQSASVGSSVSVSQPVVKPSYSGSKKSKNVGAREAKGRMVYRRSNGRVIGCALAGRKIPIEWCEPFYPLPKKNHCEASFKPSGAVINLWCK